LDVRNKDVTGKVAEKRLDEINITVNKNTIPNDPESPFVTSGIRIGTPAITSMGLQESDMAEIADIMNHGILQTQPQSELVNRVAKLMDVYKD